MFFVCVFSPTLLRIVYSRLDASEQKKIKEPYFIQLHTCVRVHILDYDRTKLLMSHGMRDCPGTAAVDPRPLCQPGP